MAATFTNFDSNMSGHNRYIVDIDRYFSIFPSIDYRLLISCRKGPILKISTIHHDVFVHAPSLVFVVWKIGRIKAFNFLVFV